MNAYSLVLVAVVAVCVGAQSSSEKKNMMPITIDANTECSADYKVDLSNSYKVQATGKMNKTAGECVYAFEADPTTASGCSTSGVCYMFNVYTYFKDDKVTVMAGSKTYGKDNIPGASIVCSDNTNLRITFKVASSYVFDAKDSAYYFQVLVFNRCGDLGQRNSVSFEEAKDGLDGYHHGEARQDRERTVFITGILLGFGLASIFLVVLLVGYCYTRNSPNRKPSRSGSSVPKVGGFKKTMTPGKESKDVEMGVRYQAHDPDRMVAAPLITSSKTGTKDSDDDDDHDDEKKKTCDVKSGDTTHDCDDKPSGGDNTGGSCNDNTTSSGPDHSSSGGGGGGGGDSSYSGGGGGGYSGGDNSYSGGGGGGYSSGGGGGYESSYSGGGGYSGGGCDSGGGGGGGGGGGCGGGGGSDD